MLNFFSRCFMVLAGMRLIQHPRIARMCQRAEQTTSDRRLRERRQEAKTSTSTRAWGRDSFGDMHDQLIRSSDYGTGRA